MRSELLCGDLYLFVQEFRGEVGAVRPAYGVQFGVQDELFEIRGLAQRLKYLSAEFTAQVYVAFGSIVETPGSKRKRVSPPPNEEADNYKPPKPSDSTPDAPPPANDDDVFGDW